MFGMDYEAVKPEDIPNFLDESWAIKEKVDDEKDEDKWLCVGLFNVAQFLLKIFINVIIKDNRFHLSHLLLYLEFGWVAWRLHSKEDILWKI